MHGFTQKALAALLGLCMASAMAAPHDPAFNAFMQLAVGNKTTVSFAGNGTPLVASSAPLGQPAIGQFGVSRTAQGVFMESIGGARVPGTNTTIPVKGRIQLSGQVIGKTLAKAAIVYTLWEAGSALYGIWSDAGLGFDSHDGSVFTTGGDPHPSALSQRQLELLHPRCTAMTLTNQEYNGFCQSGSNINQTGFCHHMYGGTLRLFTIGHPDILPPNSGTQQWSAFGFCSSSRLVYWKLAERTDAPSTRVVLNQQQIEDHIAQQSSWPTDRITSAIRDALRLPGVAPEIVPNLRNAPLEVTFPSGTPVVEVGEPETRTTTRILPNGDVEEITRTTTRRARTTTGQPSIKWEEETTTRRIVRAPDGTVISDETTEQETAPQTDQNITCGLPGTPPCKIDEEGTPQPPEDDAESIFQLLVPNCLKNDFRSCFPELPSVNWSFSLPTGCAPIQVPFGQYGFSQINLCQWKPMIHDLMSMLWAAAGLFGAISIISGRRNTEG